MRVGSPVIGSAEPALRVSAALDARYHRLRGAEVGGDKDRAFRELFRVLEQTSTPYALIGGVALAGC